MNIQNKSSKNSLEFKSIDYQLQPYTNPELIKENYTLIENVKLFSNENKLLFREILSQTKNLEEVNFESLNVDKNLINRILKYASIKHILAKNLNDDQKILEILNEVLRDLKNYELELRISDLESKFSKDLSEATFNELKELKKQLKIN